MSPWFISLGVEDGDGDGPAKERQSGLESRILYVGAKLGLELLPLQEGMDPSSPYELAVLGQRQKLRESPRQE